MCDDETISVGMSVVMTALVTGQAIGPIIGGFTSFPGAQYPEVFGEGNLFSVFPILLPYVLICTGLGVGVVLTVRFVPRTDVSNLLANIGTKGIYKYGALDEYHSEETSDLKTESNETAIGQKTSTSSNETDIETSSKTTSCSAIQRFRQLKFLRVFEERDCVLCAIIYGMFALTDIGFIEMFPVLAATHPKYGGPGFTTRQIGTLYLVVSLPLAVLQFTVIPKLNKKCGSKRLLVASNLFLALLCPLLPTVSSIRWEQAVWACMSMLVFMIRMCVFTSYLSLNILLSNSVSPALVGSANGIAMTFAALGRLLGPLAFGPLFSWSLTNNKNIINNNNKNYKNNNSINNNNSNSNNNNNNNISWTLTDNVWESGSKEGNHKPLGFPLDENFVFLLLSVWSVCIAVLASRLDEKLDYKKIEEPSDS